MSVLTKNDLAAENISLRARVANLEDRLTEVDRAVCARLKALEDTVGDCPATVETARKHGIDPFIQF